MHTSRASGENWLYSKETLQTRILFIFLNVKYTKKNAEGFHSLVNLLVTALLHKFDTSFEELDENANTIRLFENPFACDVEEVPAEYQLEVIDIQMDIVLQD